MIFQALEIFVHALTHLMLLEVGSINILTVNMRYNMVKKLSRHQAMITCGDFCIDFKSMFLGLAAVHQRGIEKACLSWVPLCSGEKLQCCNHEV